MTSQDKLLQDKLLKALQNLEKATTDFALEVARPSSSLEAKLPFNLRINPAMMRLSEALDQARQAIAEVEGDNDDQS